MPTCSQWDPVTCGICICNPPLAAVGSAACALNIAPASNVCGGGVGTASCGMPQVTIAAKQTNFLPWLIGGAVVLWFLARKR